MALFQRSVYGEEPGFTNLFRMLDAFENYSAQNRPSGRHHRQRTTINPKFDVVETDTAYELHGELPGVDRKDVQIDFTEPQTVVISGRVERSYSSGNPSVNDTPADTPADTPVEAAEPSHKAKVSDEAEEVALEKGEGQSAVDVVNKDEVSQPQHRFWHQERSVGSFSRTFTFPTRIDDSAARASLTNGVLQVSIPKAAKPQNRSITIE